MHKKSFFILLMACSFVVFSNAQSISIDGRFDDWANASTYLDAAADGNGVDLAGLSVTNDGSYLYIRLITNGNVNLSDSNNLYLNIDADNNSSTGFGTNGIGSELGWRWGYKYGLWYHGVLRDTVYSKQLGLLALTTHKNDTFEIAISRNILLGPTQTPLFASASIRLNFVNGISGGDQLPNAGKTYTYTFTNTTLSEFAPIELAKCNSSYIRVMSYNTAFDGLVDNARSNQFRRILQSISPDIIVFNECTYTTYQQAKTNLDSWIPLSNGNGWYSFKVDPGNIICSRFPIKGAKNVSFRKATFTYIDLPATYQTDLVFIGTHLMYFNDGDSVRQLETDQLSAFIRDMKLGLTNYSVPANTPFIIAGDYNLVNSYSPLNTLLTGNIVNTSIYGTAPYPDWDNVSPLKSVYAKIADRDVAYTWRSRGDSARWLPGKLDYIVYSGTNLQLKKSFVLQSELMSPTRLTQYALLSGDSYTASDHLPIVADFQIPTTSTPTQTVQWNGKINSAWETPANWDCSMVPDKYSNVVIHSGTPNYPYISSDTEIHSINLNTNSLVNVKPGVKFLINGP